MDEQEKRKVNDQMQAARDDARRIGLRVAEIKNRVLEQQKLGNKQAAVDALGELTQLSQKLLALGRTTRTTFVDLKSQMEELQQKAEAEAARVKREGEKP